ncbi:efflux RND transporter periplasmic adaptor subunit [Siphonobacter aquaeclarae]|uniref:Biotin-lipoyl like n=1 Tax=Siphonobacter aquaeclarae TaxID=563176 RepID=A0A1G9YPL7_9BACT|nr:HlyD family efflux transporter periplasmic adaptor subunit [Siphonobacter aquaeclarae]SDN11024.1 Biotin-lipoyl like [Siphonobacter aquaeclarae]
MNSICSFNQYASLATCLWVLASCQQQERTSPQRKTVEDAVFASGHLEQENEYVVAASVDGTLQRLSIKEGDQVPAGAVLAHIKSDVTANQLTEAELVYTDAARNASAQSPQLSQLSIQIDQATAQLEQDLLNWQRYKALRASNSVSQLEAEKAELQYKASVSALDVLKKNHQELERSLKLQAATSRTKVKSQQSLLADYQVRVARAGVVLTVYKKEGELVRKGDVIARIGSGASVIKLFVAEEDIGKIRLGQAAVVQLNTYPDTVFKARLSKIYPAFEETQQSYVVEARLLQSPVVLFSGTQVQANVVTGVRNNILVIPASYLSKGKLVTLESGGQRVIVSGYKSKEWVEVRSGISEKDVILRTNE